MRSTPAVGLETMLGLAGELPNDLVRGFRAGRDLAVAPLSGDRPVVAVGMGASAIAADLAKGVVEAESPASLAVVRGTDLPRAVDRRSRVLVLSYSGETTEALGAYDLAGRRGAQRVVLASGGPLADRADDDGVPVLRVPAGRPPRTAVGDLLGGILGILDPVFVESNEHRLDLAAAQLRDAVPRLRSPRGPAAEAARALDGRLPFVVADHSFVALARRWKTQFEENAKRLAAFDELSEALHNSLVGWDALPSVEARRYALVLLEWAGEVPVARGAARHLRRVAEARRVRTVRVPLDLEDRLGALVHGIALGDFASLELARRRGVDPYPIAAITRGRAAIAATARRAGLPGGVRRQRQARP